MASSITDHDEALKLGHGDAQSAKAPARRFALPDTPDRTFWSPGIFAVLSMGLGAYLGRLREIVNPSPNTQAPDEQKTVALDDGTTAPVEDAPEAGLDIAAFWQEIQRAYEDVAEQIEPPRRLYSSIRFNAQDFALEGGYAGRPFQGVTIDVAANDFRFVAASVAKPKLAAFGLPRAANNTPAAGQAADGNSDKPDDSGLPVDTSSVGGSSSGGTSGSPPAPTNRAPLSRGPIYLGTGLVNLSMLLMWADLARAAVDPDGDPLTITAIQATSGEIRTYGSDAWIYVPERDKQGMVTLTFTVSDGKATIQGKAFLDLRSHPETEITGIATDDVLIGTPGKDLIDAGMGNDIVYGREGDDLILGGVGDDLLIGGDGRDVIHGGDGHDRIFGGEGDDVLLGDAGNDMLFGEAGRDSLLGGAGNDVLSGGDGEDRLFGEDGNDVLSGDAGADVLEGGAGHDTLAGGAGEDVMVGNDGDDVFVAGLQPVLDERRLANIALDLAPADAAAPVGSDEPSSTAGAHTSNPITTVATVNDGNDVVHGGEGNDTYDASFAITAVEINLEAGSAIGEEIGSDRLTSIENAVGGAADDILTASSAVNILYGNGGHDTFVFGSVASIANGGAGHDEIRDFNVGDKVDLSTLERELGRLYFDDGDTSLELNGDDHKTLVKLFKKMIDDEDVGHHVLQLVTDIDGDQDYEIVIISANGLDEDDLILTAFHLPGQVEGLVA
ncbi:MAG: cadherin-like domain-containing protein [Rhizobium sp.]|nr:cadherin-like domain-containing protein [Rhizobium sp.]